MKKPITVRIDSLRHLERRMSECPKCGFEYVGMTCECEWQCCFPGECIMAYQDHMANVCYTVEMAEAYYKEGEQDDE